MGKSLAYKTVICCMLYSQKYVSGHLCLNMYSSVMLESLCIPIFSLLLYHVSCLYYCFSDDELWHEMRNRSSETLIWYLKMWHWPLFNDSLSYTRRENFELGKYRHISIMPEMIFRFDKKIFEQDIKLDLILKTKQPNRGRYNFSAPLVVKQR